MFSYVLITLVTSNITLTLFFALNKVRLYALFFAPNVEKGLLWLPPLVDVAEAGAFLGLALIAFDSPIGLPLLSLNLALRLFLIGLWFYAMLVRLH